MTITFIGAAFLMLAALVCPDGMAGVAFLGMLFGASTIAAASWLGDLKVLQRKTRTEIMFERTAPWLPGETTAERDARRSRQCSVVMEQCLPDEIPGKVISSQRVVPGRKSFTQMADKDRLVVICDLTDAELKSVEERNSRIDPTTGLPVARTLEDRFGAVLPMLVSEYGSREDVFAKWQEADAARQAALLDPEIHHETSEFELCVRRLQQTLPQTVTHTGTGNYYVKVSPTLHNDTQSGAPVGQTINLTTGGLGVNAFIGGYISNTTRSEIRSIVSNAAGSAVLEGSLTNWQDTDVLEVYDAWLLSSVGWAQIFTDQGSTTMTANQYLRVFAGTYIEANITPSTTFNTSPVSNAIPIWEGDPASARDNIIIRDNGSVRLLTLSGSTWTVKIRHMWLDAKIVTANGILVVTTSYLSTISDCRMSTDTNRQILQGDPGYLKTVDCIIEGRNGPAGTIARGLHYADRTLFLSGSSGAFSETEPGIIEYKACVFAGLAIGISGSSAYDRQFRVLNCTFYDNITDFNSRVTMTDPLFEFKNCIFQGATTQVFYFRQISDETTDYYGQPLTIQNCYFYDYANFAYVEDTASFYTFPQVEAWGSVTASGNADGVDPLLADPANGDFSLQVSSPCRNAGTPAGVRAGYNGVAMDLTSPDIGAWSSGPLAADPPTWTSNLSGIVATDAQTSGEVKLTWDPATPGTGDVGYIVESRTTSGPGAWGEDARTITNGTALDPFIVGGLANDVSRDFRVKAYSRISGEPTTTPNDTSTATPTAIVPQPAQITATDLLNQSDVRVDVVADNPADENTVFYQIVPGGVIQEWPTPVTGSGSETLTGLLVKPYVIYAVPQRGGCTGEPSNLVFLTVQAADQYTNIRTALYEWIKGVVGNPEVIWREPNAPQPSRQYVSIKMNPTVPVGSDYHSGADTNGIESVEGNREFVFSIQVHGKPANEDGSASITILERIRSSLEKRSTQATLSAAGLSFVIVEGFGDLAGIGGTEYEARAFIDIRFRTTYSDDDDVGYIGTVEKPVGTYDE
jgi:hypothetical protein